MITAQSANFSTLLNDREGRHEVEERDCVPGVRASDYDSDPSVSREAGLP